jgi:competence CoiA-like predicted nuclease
MAKITECVIGVDLANSIREVADALGLKVPRGRLGFRCPNCGQSVKPMVSGGNQAAHFEHLKRNRGCKLSHAPRSA